MRPVRRCGDQAVVRRDGTTSRKFEIRSFQLHNHKIGCIEHLQFKAAPAVQREHLGHADNLCKASWGLFILCPLDRSGPDRH